MSTPQNRTFETEGEAIERAVQRTIEHRDIETRNLLRAVYRFRDAVLVHERKAIPRPLCKTSTASWRGRKRWWGHRDRIFSELECTSVPDTLSPVEAPEHETGR